MIQTKLTATAPTICLTQEEYQSVLQRQVQLTHGQFDQTLLIHVDLSATNGVNDINSDISTRFYQAFQAIVNKEHVNEAGLIYHQQVWNKKEVGYRLTLLLNRAAYPDVSNHGTTGLSLISNIEKAWGTAIDGNVNKLIGKVIFPTNPIHVLNNKIRDVHPLTSYQ